MVERLLIGLVRTSPSPRDTPDVVTPELVLDPESYSSFLLSSFLVREERRSTGREGGRRETGIQGSRTSRFGVSQEGGTLGTSPLERQGVRRDGRLGFIMDVGVTTGGLLVHPNPLTLSRYSGVSTR